MSFLFHPPTWLLLVRNANAKSEPRAYICALKTSFFQVAEKYQVLCQTIGEVFFVVFAKTQRCQPDLVNCWRCSNSSHLPRSFNGCAVTILNCHDALAGRARGRSACAPPWSSQPRCRLEWRTAAYLRVRQRVVE